MTNDDVERRTTMRDYLRILRRRWRTATTVFVLVMLAAGGLLAISSPRYVGQADVLVEPTTTDVQVSGSATITPEEMATQVRVATSQPVGALVAKRMPSAPTDLSKTVSAQAIGSSRIIRITATADTAAAAGRLASRVARSYIAYRQTEAQAAVAQVLKGYQDERAADITRIAAIGTLLKRNPTNRVDLETERRDLQSKVSTLGAQISALGPLQSPGGSGGQVLQSGPAPASSRLSTWVLTLFMAFLLALFAALVAAVVRDRLDDVVRDEETLDDSLADAPVAGVVRRFPKTVVPGALVQVVAPLSPSNRDVNALAIAIRHLAGRSPSLRHAALVMVTSPTPAGSSLLSENVAAAAAQQGLLVVEVDANPEAAATEPDEKGLYDILAGELEPRSYLVETGMDNLARLPAGQPTTRAVNLFTGPRLQQVMRDLGQGVDLVLLNVPAEIALSSLHLMSDVDVCLVVAREGRTHRSDVTRLVESLRAFGARTVAGALFDARSRQRIPGAEHRRAASQGR